MLWFRDAFFKTFKDKVIYHLVMIRDGLSGKLDDFGEQLQALRVMIGVTIVWWLWLRLRRL